MNNFIIYSIEITISLALFYSAYWLFLKNETFFKLNRSYLLSSIAFSLIAPLLNISIITNAAQDSFFTKHLILPIEQFEQRIMGNSGYETFHTNSAIVHALRNENDMVGDGVNDGKLNSEDKNISSVPVNGKSNKEINWLTIAFVIYLTGAGLLLVRFLANFIWIFKNALRHTTEEISGMKVIRLQKNISPFSFLKLIFISNKDYPEEELSKIIQHEKVHMKQRHAIDVILLELLLIFQWFNPLFWLYRRAIKDTHEYLADEGTLNAGIEISSYQYSLLNQTLQNNNIEIASHYNLSIKKRITMMLKKRSSGLSVLKVTIALPIILFLFSAFAFNCKPSEKDNVQSRKNESSIQDTIKKVDVPVEYLKLLEGEYVSNNPGTERRIVFTEVFGELLAWDRGYTFRPIYVGNGKFINPDDKATLVFDTTDKSKISLLLFGKINLNKVMIEKGSGNVQNRSLAYSMLKVMDKKGIPEALSFYAKAKDSTNYYFAENEMNYAGYQMLQRGKAKDAAAIFKLNIERFPNSFNVFDSYAEALLALGEKTQAIENYKKSLRLNPGSKSAIKHLKELGVNPDDVVKIEKAPIEYLKLLEGTYLSTNEPNWKRKIIFTIEDGVLAGEDNGYRYKLIPMGDGKFINPDDGASLVFDTKNKNAISLLLFGQVNLKKVVPSNQPPLNLKEYSGLYIPENEVILRPMEIINSNNKLFRFIETDPQGVNRTVELDYISDNIFSYTDNSNRSIEFLINTNNEVTGCILRRPDGAYKLRKKK